MKTYRITNTVSGVTLGTYCAATEQGALDGLARDAGYASHGAAKAALGYDSEPELEVTELPSRAAAKRQAHQESSMYKQGSGWVVSTWDESVRAKRLTDELSFSEARQRLADWRRNRAMELLGE